MKKVIWNDSEFNVAVAKEYEIKGKILTEKECKQEAICKVYINSKEQLLESFFGKNNIIKNEGPKEAIEKVKTLPISVLYKMKKNLTSIYYTKENLNNIQGAKNKENNGLEFFKEDTNQLFIHYPINSNGFINTTMVTLHGIGHSYDMKNKNGEKISNTELFKKAYSEEANKIFNINDKTASIRSHKYYASFSNEYFAQCFAYYFGEKELVNEFKNKAPKTYKIINESLNEI